MRKNQKIYVAGHRGLIGSAVYRGLEKRSYTNIIGKTRHELDLLDASAVERFFKIEQPEAVVLTAAMVGGIHANNNYRTEFIFNNLQIQNNVIMSALRQNVDKLVFLGSSCIYPREVPQPMSELALLNGSLEYTNRPYAIAKIAGLELVNAIRTQYNKNFFSVMPTNLYGPGDNFHLENSHVLPALIRKIHEAKVKEQEEVVIWGTGKPLREFLFVDDCADAIIHLLQEIKTDSFDDTILSEGKWSHINLGSGQEVSIANLASMISEAFGYRGKLVFDTSKPDGTPRKLMDSTLLNELGWKPKTNLQEGIQKTIQWYLQAEDIRGSDGEKKKKLYTKALSSNSADKFP